MRLRKRIMMLVVAAGFVLAPALALAAACEACCCPPPCHDAVAGCEAAFSSASCCEQASVATLPPAKRGEATPVPALVVDRMHAADPSPRRLRPVARGSDLACRASPRRLSVVLIV